MFVFLHDRQLSEIYSNRRPDNCTFFPVVVFSSLSLCSNTNTNYDWKKIRPEKKVQSSGRLCFSAGSFADQITTGKNTTGKKRYSCLADGLNKSQITVCCVKIQTPIITTGKKYDWKKRYSRLVVGWSTKHKTQHTQTQQPTR